MEFCLSRFCCEFEKRERVKYGGLITSCEKGRYGDWYFIFENGQVWKVVGSRKPRFQECNFYVTLETDGFGYKMTGLPIYLERAEQMSESGPGAANLLDRLLVADELNWENQAVLIEELERIVSGG